MGTITSLYGRLATAPVNYTLFMLRFPPEQLTDEKVAAIQSALKAEYPLYNPINRQTIQINFSPSNKADGGMPIPTPSANKEHHFLNSDKTAGIALFEDKIFFQTKNYDCFETFSDRVEKALTLLNGYLNIQVYLMAGFRMIDVIHPDKSKKEDFATYLKPRFLPHTPSQIDDQQFTWDSGQQFFRYKTPLGFVNFKCIWPQKIKYGIPLDLQDLAQVLNFQNRYENQESTILDTDHVMINPDQTAFKFDIPQLIQKLDEMHNVASAVFLDAVTPEAIEIWRAK